ncbi:TRAP transporter large permease subunit [Chloroflexota bacterium]
MEYWVVPVSILFGGLFVGLVFGLPMAFTLGGAAIVAGFIFQGTTIVELVIRSTYGPMTNLILVALPLFILMASVLEKSGIADDLFTAMHQWTGPLRGGIAIAVVGICTLIAAMSGVSTAGVVTMGIIALPIMLRKGYNKSIAIGPILAGGALGILIPPSTTFIVYGMLTRTSIGRLFAGGVIPGLILSVLYMSYIGIRCYFQPHLGPPLAKEERVSLVEKIKLSRGLILPILLIVSVLGSIFAGIASPTESAAVGALGAVICAAIHRRLNWTMFREAAVRTASVTGMVMWILFGAFCFASVFISTGGPTAVKEFVTGLDVTPIFVIFLMQVSYMILGCFMDEITILFLTIPIYMPILVGFGYDPVWFGVLFIVNMQMAYLTPPFGLTLFYMRGIAPPGVTLMDIYRSVVPFVGIQLIVLILVLFFPQLSLWLPDVVFGLK